MENWLFTDLDGSQTKLDLPHTWNAIDGQDGGNDLYRGTAFYAKTIEKVDLPEAVVSKLGQMQD